MEFDENKAIQMMRKAVSPESAKIYDDDELLNVIDMIWDYYEENGMLDIDMTDTDETPDEELETDLLIEYVRRMLRKDKAAKIKYEDVPALVAAELAYEETLL